MLTDFELVGLKQQSVECLTTYWTTGRSGFDSRQRRKGFSCNLSLQACSGDHPASSPMGTGSKARLGHDADHSAHLVPRSRMSRNYIFSPPKRLYVMLWDRFTYVRLKQSSAHVTTQKPIFLNIISAGLFFAYLKTRGQTCSV
jgi:hypothetical protein